MGEGIGMVIHSWGKMYGIRKGKSHGTQFSIWGLISVVSLLWYVTLSSPFDVSVP